MKIYIRYAIVVVFSSLFILFVYKVWLIENTPPYIPYIPYSDLITKLHNNQIRSLHLKGNDVRGVNTFNENFSSYAPELGSLMKELDGRDMMLIAEDSKPSGLWQFLSNLMPMLILLGGYFIYVKVKSGKIGFAKQIKSVKLDLKGSDKKMTFNDVAWIPKAKDELLEVVEFLKNPQKYTSLGGRIPKGVLLQGQLWTGKILMAKAIAGEVNVPFYTP